MEMSGGEALARQLVLEGVADVFGVPGVQLDYAVDGLAQVSDRIAFRHTRHEQGAAYMADGYARATGDVGVCMVVPGPGMLNAMAALSTAYACSSRVLAIVGQIPSTLIGRDLGILHEVAEQSRTLATVTKWSGIAFSPTDVPRLVHDAMRQVRSGSPAPVAIEIPPDVLQARGDIELIEDREDLGPVVPDTGEVAAAAAILRAARRPVIYVGGGVVAGDASDELRALAEHLGAPVISSLHGRDALSDRHPLSLTNVSGRDILPDADVVLVVGSRFIDGRANQIWTPSGARIILVNSQRKDLGAPRIADVAILGDSRLTLEALRAAVGPAREVSDDPRLEDARASAAEQVDRIEPQAGWVRALRKAIPEDGVLVTELTQVGFLADVGYPVYGPRTYITPGYQGTLGYGFATAMGAKVGRPDRVVVSISGDGGFGWNLQELATAKRHGIALIAIVFADGTFGNVQRMQRAQFDGRVYATDLANPDFVALAEAFGITGERAETPEELVTAIGRAIASDEPVLIEVPMPVEVPSPWHLIHEPVHQPREQVER